MSAPVTALLVSHEGARWLPGVLDALAAQTRPPDRVVAVDTGSTDEGPELVAARYGQAAVHRLGDVGYPAAVAHGLAHAPAADGSEWVWLLHDDSAPAPDALDLLLAAAAADPGPAPPALLGPKLREWPSLRRLLEVGVTLGGTGRRETGLERGEYDQGQHDRVRDVLAVNTAGLLVRRDVLEQLGLDPDLPVLGGDLDLGWRAALAGHRTVVVPEAVVFHVEATRRGTRRSRLVRRPHREDRRATLHTLLANGPAGRLPVRWIRLLLGGMLRALGLLLVRAPGEALDEVAALAAVHGRPDRLLAARRRRRGTRVRAHREVRPLLAPWWLPYRHGADTVGDVLTALVREAGDVTARRAGRDRVPWALALLGLALLALWAARDLVGSGALAGGALLPAPASAASWWQTYLASGHDLGTGSAAPAAAYLLPLAAAGTLLLGEAGLVVDLLLLGAVPLAAVGARRLLRRLTGSPVVATWGAVTYGLVPVLSGAVQQGRLGTVAVAVVLPWLVHAALGLGEGDERRRRAAWRVALWLALAAAFAPVTWVLAVAVGAVALAAGAAVDPGWRRPHAVGAVAVALLTPLVLLLPWTWQVWAQQGAAAWLTEPGLRDPGLLADPGAATLLLGRPGTAAAPGWVWAGVAVAALAALARRDRRGPVLAAWLVGVVALGFAAVLGGVEVALSRESVPTRPWPGVPLLVAQGAAVVAVAVAAAGLRAHLSATSFGWRQPVAAVAALGAVVAPVAGLAWWAAAGSDGPLQRSRPPAVPAYLAQAASADPARGVLVLRGDTRSGLTHLRLRDAGLRLGDDSVLPAAEDQAPLTEAVARLAVAGAASDAAALQELGVGAVYLPPPADPDLAASLDATPGLERASAPRRGARAWQLAADPAVAAPAVESSAARPFLLAGQALALLVVAVLAAPSRGVRR